MSAAAVASAVAACYVVLNGKKKEENKIRSDYKGEKKTKIIKPQFLLIKESDNQPDLTEGDIKELERELEEGK